MSLSPAGTAPCEPTELYNILTQCSQKPAVLDETYLVLLDARDRTEYDESHIILARHSKKDEQGHYRVSFGVHFPTCLHCVVYDSNTVSVLEDTPAVRLANFLASSGSKNAVRILKGGYERFSGEYPFLRTQKIIYTPKELERLPLYPNEVVPLFLYLGDHRHAYNAAMNYDLRVHAHLNMAAELGPAYPGKIVEMRTEVKDETGTDLLARFQEIFDFLESHRQKSERVLVFSELGISGAAAAVVAYLIRKNHWTLKKAYEHVRNCRHHIQPLQAFIEQLSQWESQVHGQSLTNISEL